MVKEFCLIKRLSILIRERFPLGQYGPMILVFSLANGLYFSSVNEFSLAHFFIVLLVLTSSFLRLRLFDEIKDYEVDLKINPSRPLARGVLTRDQVKFMIILLIGFELALCAILGKIVFFIHLMAIGYSLLMFEEFFIGLYLRPRLTTYAVTHTFVSVLLATTAVAGSVKDLSFPHTLPSFLFLCSNWMFFNLFEFARKSYARTEERANVDTYTSLFGIPSAVLLSLSQVVLGVGLLYLSVEVNLMPIFILAIVYAFICIGFIFSQTPWWAKLFRNISGLYLLFHYVALAWLLGKDLL